MWNTYGPTEVTVQVVTGAIPRGATRVPLGRPDFNVHTYVSTFPNEENGETMEGFKARVSELRQPQALQYHLKPRHSPAALLLLE